MASSTATNAAYTAAPFASVSLYVGDLDPETTETELHEKFSTVGEITSIRLCRDTVTRQSLGYAYVNYQDSIAAERAIATLNFSDIRGKQCRVSWVQRDASLRRSGVGNVFVNKLPETVDNKSLFDTFSTFGNVVSSKVSVDRDTGKPLGFGFVQFESDEIATNVISKSPIEIAGVPVTVAAYKLKKDRGTANTAFTNVYIKNIPDSWTKEDLDKQFSQFGAITSSTISTSEAEFSAGQKYAFVNFASHEEAQNAVESAGNIEIEGKKLYAVRALNKVERERQKRAAADARRVERLQKFAQCNLYIKHLPETVTEEQLTELFSKYGTITSARLSRFAEDSRPTGTAFVCFSTADEAAKAIAEVNQTSPFGSKPLLVTLHQTKAARAQQRQAEMWANPLRNHTHGYFPHPQMPGMVLVPNHYKPGPGYYPANGMRPPFGGPMPFGGMRGGPRGPRVGPAGVMAGAAGPRGPRGPRQTGAPRRPRGPVAQAPLAGGFDMNTFSQLSPDHQRNYLGELIFPKVSAINTEQAPKITGMLIEMDANEVIKLLHSEEELVSKVTEALEVLRDAGETA